MMKQIITLSLLFSITIHLQAQITLRGTVADSLTNEPIGFVNIGILENTNGTVSTENGDFKLALKDEKNKTIRFSSIGYESKTFTSEDLRKIKKVYLRAVVYDAGIVKIKAKKFKKQKKLGAKIHAKLNTIAWGSSEFSGLEIGVPIKIRKESFIKSAHFGILKASSANTRLRINIYDFKNGKIGKNLMTENVFVYAKDLVRYGKVDLSHLNLVVKNDILLSIETIEKEEKEGFYLIFGSGLRWKGNVYSRDASQAIFQKNKMENRTKIGAFLKVKQVK
ncbi:MAG: carboxypeptidase-like regulatory domain-containing protein [Saprospiraceae bacterium]